MTTVTNSNFVGVQWDGKSVEVLQTVAQGLLNLTEVFKSQNISIKCLLKIQDSETKSPPSKRRVRLPARRHNGMQEGGEDDTRTT